MKQLVTLVFVLGLLVATTLATNVISLTEAHALLRHLLARHPQIHDMFPTNSKGIPPPYTKNGQIPDNHLLALDFQRDLQMNLTLDKLHFGGSHNAHIDYSDSYGITQGELSALVQLINSNEAVQISNHWVTVTDQMNMGTRHVELDIHYLWGDIRICHAGGVHQQWINKLVHTLEILLNRTIHWDSETIGCISPKDPTLDDALTEIRNWLNKPENAKEFLILYFDDEPDLGKWHFVSNVTLAIERHVAELVFTPAMKEKLGRWPTWTEMAQTNKRIIFASGTNYTRQELLPYMFYKDDVWEEHGSKRFKPYPACEPKVPEGNPVQMLRMNGAALWYAWFYKEDDFINLNMLQQMQECENINFVSTDLLIPELAAGFVWSWKETEKPTRGACTVLDVTAGRWQIAPCNSNYAYACQNKQTKEWQVQGKGPRNAASCATDYSFAIPLNGGQNRKLRDAAASHDFVWLNN